LDREVLLTFAKRLLAQRSPMVKDLQLEGEGDRLCLQVVVRWAGFPLHAQLELEEIRFREGILGCRLVALRGPMGIPTPASLLRLLLGKLPVAVSWDSQDRVLLVDLRQLLPSGLRLTVEDVRLTQGFVEVYLGAGTLSPPLPPLESLEEEAPLGI
jgi:hypothetical protein